MIHQSSVRLIEPQKGAQEMKTKELDRVHRAVLIIARKLSKNVSKKIAFVQSNK